MRLRKILEAYKLSHEFTEMMEEFEAGDIKYSDLEKSVLADKYARHEEKREGMMRESRCETIAGAFFFLARHPKKMISAQKYYHNKFGKPCRI